MLERRERERERDRQTYRHTDRQTDIQTYREIGDRERERENGTIQFLLAECQ